MGPAGEEYEGGWGRRVRRGVGEDLGGGGKGKGGERKSGKYMMSPSKISYTQLGPELGVTRGVI